MARTNSDSTSSDSASTSTLVDEAVTGLCLNDYDDNDWMTDLANIPKIPTPRQSDCTTHDFYLSPFADTSTVYGDMPEIPLVSTGAPQVGEAASFWSTLVRSRVKQTKGGPFFDFAGERSKRNPLSAPSVSWTTCSQPKVLPTKSGVSRAKLTKVERSGPRSAPSLSSSPSISTTTPSRTNVVPTKSSVSRAKLARNEPLVRLAGERSTSGSRSVPTRSPSRSTSSTISSRAKVMPLKSSLSQVKLTKDEPLFGFTSERSISGSRPAPSPSLSSSPSVSSTTSSQNKLMPTKSSMSSSSSRKSKGGPSIGRKHPSVKFAEKPTIHYDHSYDAEPEPYAPRIPIKPQTTTNGGFSTLKRIVKSWGKRRDPAVQERPSISGPYPIYCTASLKTHEQGVRHTRSHTSIRSTNSASPVSGLRLLWNRLTCPGG